MMGRIALLPLFIAVASGCSPEQRFIPAPDPFERAVILNGANQTATVANAPAPEPICVAAMANDEFLVGEPVRWELLDPTGSVIATRDAVTSAQGRDCWQPQVGAVIGAHVVRVRSADGSTPAETRIHLRATRLRLDPQVMWAGDTLPVVLHVEDASGAALTPPAAWPLQGLTADFFRIPGGRFVARREGVVTLRLGEGVNGPLEAPMRVLARLRVRVLSMDSSAVAGTLVFVATESSLDSAVVDASGVADVRASGPLRGRASEILILSPDSSSRPFLPSLGNRTIDSLETINALVVPQTWRFRSGTLAGQSVPMSFAVGNSFTTIPSFMQFTWATGTPYLQSWHPADLPVRVALVHDASLSPITAADSTTFWGYLDEMEAMLGLNILEPAELEDVIDHSIPYNSSLTPLQNSLQRVRRAIVVMSEPMDPLGTGGGVTKCSANRGANPDECGPLFMPFARGGVTYNSNLACITNCPSTVVHEILHAFGHGHACQFDTVMLAPGDFSAEFCANRPFGAPPPRSGILTAHDVAFFQARAATISFLTSGALGSRGFSYLETLNGEFRRFYGGQMANERLTRRLQEARERIR